MALAENVLQSFTPFQLLTDCGAFQRKSPTGGAAKGIPLNETTSDFESFMPEINPLSIRSVSDKLFALALEFIPKHKKQVNKVKTGM